LVLPLLALLVIPAVAATPTDVREYTIHVHNQEGNSNGPVAAVGFDVFHPHGHAVVAGNTTLQVTVAYMVVGSALVPQENRYRALIDGNANNECAWNVRTNTGADTTRFFGLVFFCGLAYLEPGAHTFEVAKTDLVGNGDNVVRASTSAVIIQTEEVEPVAHDFGTAIEATTTVNILVLLCLVALAWWLWSRTPDVALRFLSVGFMIIVFFAALSQRAAWAEMLWLAILIGVFAAYMGFRTGAKALEARKVTG
jgi:hypothetical protein